MKKIIMIALLGIFMFSFTSGALVDNVIAHYNFDEASGTTVSDSTGNHDGTSSGGVTFGATGIIGNALSFDGSNDIVTVPHHADFNFGTGDFTINGWIKRATGATYEEIASKADNSGTYDGWGFHTTNAKKTSIYLDNSGSAIFTGTTDVATNNWVMVTYRRDGDVVELWVNGTLDTSDTGNSAKSATSSNDLLFGNLPWGAYGVSTQDEWTIWDRAITDAEIGEIYNSHVGLTYPFSTGTTITQVHLEPNNDAMIDPTNVTLKVNLTMEWGGEAYNWTNTTFYIWDDDGNTENVTTKTLSGNWTTSEVYYTNLPNIEDFIWDTYSCYGNSTYSNCTWSDTGNETFKSYITINVLDYASNHVESVSMVCPTNSVDEEFSSPFQGLYSTFSSVALENVSCTISDLDSYNKPITINITFNETAPVYNISLEQKELILHFQHYNGTPTSVTGYYSNNTYNTENFTNSTFTNILKDLYQGKIRVLFGYNSSVTNYTQYYEYENDWITNSEENMTIVENPDTTAFIKVIDESGQVVEGVLIRMAYSLPSQGGTYKEMGQRFTGDDGFTSFYIDPLSDIAIRWSKDDYTADDWTFDAGEYTFTAEDPLKITIKRSSQNTYRGAQLKTYSFYHTNMTIIQMSMYAPSRSIVKYSTSYRESLGLTNGTVSLDQFKKGVWNLSRGTDFCTTCETDLTVTIYLDGALWDTITIPYQEIVTNKFEEPSTLSSDTLKKVVWIFLLIFAGILGLLIKPSEEEGGSGAYGKPLFLILATLAGLIWYDEFGFLLMIVGFFGLGTLLKGWISE